MICSDLSRCGVALFEDYGFVAVEQDAVFDVPAYRAGEDYLFDVAALFYKVLDRVSVRDAFDTLLNDGAVIEHFGDIVSGSSDNFHAAVEGLLMGFGADECGQKGMVNIDDLLRKLLDKAGRKDLHIAGQNNQFDIIFAKQL